MTAALAAMLAASAPMAFAQSATTASPDAAGTAPHTAITTNHLMPGQIRVTEMTGATVYDNQNRYIGDVKDIILDRDGRIAAVILDVSSFLGIGGRYVAVPMPDIKVSFDADNKPHFSVDKTREQLKVAQAYDISEKRAISETTTPPGVAETSDPPGEPNR